MGLVLVRETGGGAGVSAVPSLASVSPAMPVGCESKEAGRGFITVQGMRNKQGELGLKELLEIIRIRDLSCK